MSEHTVLIGGIMDGERVEVRGEPPFLQFAERPLVSALAPVTDEAAAEDVVERRDYYTPRHFTTPDRRWTLYALEGMTDAQLFERLLDNYRPAAR